MFLCGMCGCELSDPEPFCEDCLEMMEKSHEELLSLSDTSLANRLTPVTQEAQDILVALLSNHRDIPHAQIDYELAEAIRLLKEDSDERCDIP